MSNTIGGGIFKSNNVLPNLDDDSPKSVGIKDLSSTAHQTTERASNGLNSRVNLNDYGASMRFKLESKLADNPARQTISADNVTKQNFKTTGGDWRIRNDDATKLKFYRTGENTSGTTRFDNEYFKDTGDEFIHLNKNGALVDLPENVGKRQPENVADLDWDGYERVTPNRVPADYTSTGKTVAFENPQDANDKVNVLKRYVVDNKLITGVWDEAKTNDAFKSLLADGVKVEITEIGKRGDGKTEYAVNIDDEGLQKLRAKLSEYKTAVASDVADGKAGQDEAGKMARDLPKIVYESGRKTGETIINVVQDTGNLVLSHPETVQKSETSFGRAKIGEMYDQLSNVERDPEYNNGGLPRIDTSPLKVDYESEMMNRNIAGTNVKTGDAVSSVAGQIAPLTLGDIIPPSKSPGVLKLGEPLQTSEILTGGRIIENGNAVAAKTTQDLSEFANGKELEGFIGKEIKVGDELPEGYYWNNGKISRNKGNVDANFAKLKIDEAGKLDLATADRLSNPNTMNKNFKIKLREDFEAKGLKGEELEKAVAAEKARVQIHHLIPDEAVRNTRFGKAAQKAGYNLDEKSNLLGLPRKAENMSAGETGHWTNHPKYTKYVTDKLLEKQELLEDKYRKPIELIDKKVILDEMKGFEKKFLDNIKNEKAMKRADGSLAQLEMRRNNSMNLGDGYGIRV